MDNQTQANDNAFAPTDSNPPTGDAAAFYPQSDQAAAAPLAPSPTGSISDQLLDIKNQALAQLTPMVNNLDQKPEDRFRTIMMMIQASDNQELIKDAYAAAGQITEPKDRAQALLDIVNEINYFTQKSA